MPCPLEDIDVSQTLFELVLGKPDIQRFSQFGFTPFFSRAGNTSGLSP